MEEPWSQLVSIEQEAEVVPILGDKLTLGRKRDVSDFVISGNQHVSKCHCEVIRGRGCKAFLKDVSSNGTLLNGRRIAKNVEVELVDNDLITLVQRSDQPRLNVAFRFKVLLKEDDMEDTLVYETDTTEQVDGEESEVPKDSEGVEPGQEVEPGEAEESVVSIGQKRKLDDRDSIEGVPSAKVAPTSSEAAACLASDEASTQQQDAGLQQKDPPKPPLISADSIEQTLMCQICQEILHDCVSLQPCLHSYCAGCYSKWMDQSSVCPSCRGEVKQISKNHIVNNLVAAYLRANPDKKRPQEDIQELDSKNKITHDMLYPKRKRAHYYSSSDEDSGSDTDDSMVMLAECLQCPDFTSIHPTPTFLHPHTCTDTTRHVYCQCCHNPMPDRRDPTIHQQCSLCSGYFCHLYWTCRKPGCLGCLSLLKDMNFQRTSLNGILGNAYESNILKNYLEGKSLTIKDFHQACCAKLESGEYSCSDARATSSAICCHNCALKTLRELAYQYRKDIPSSELPAEVMRRVDCYWGKECRTQFTKIAHAQKFNHVCEKTRTN